MTAEEEAAWPKLLLPPSSSAGGVDRGATRESPWRAPQRDQLLDGDGEGDGSEGEWEEGVGLACARGMITPIAILGAAIVGFGTELSRAEPAAGSKLVTEGSSPPPAMR